MQWYIIHTYSGFEKKVKESWRAAWEGLHVAKTRWARADPMEDTIEMRGGRKVISSRIVVSGLRLVEMDLTK